MSHYLEPREVERPFSKRWIRMTLQLMGRSPARFGIVIAFLGWLDTSVIKWTSGFVVPSIWFERLGLFVVPLFLAIVVANARGADDARQTWKAFAGFSRPTLWAGAVGLGAMMVGVQWIVTWLLDVRSLAERNKYSHHPGEFLTTFAAQAAFFCAVAGICYIPLLVFEPELSEREARQLSRVAMRINQERVIILLLICWALATNSIGMLPTYGIAEAASLVFLGTLSYVAYRDIFERRSENRPATVPDAPVSAAIRQQCPIEGASR